MRTIVLGGAGNFGARIVRALRLEPSIDLTVVGRRAASVPGAEDVRSMALDVTAEDFPDQLQRLSPELLIHCVGPFQGQDYRVAAAALAAGSHYVDLADGRQFVSEFTAHVNERAKGANRSAITGASTLPALSSAVVEVLCEGLSLVESIQLVIAPGQRAPRGHATLTSVFSYLGRPVPIWREGRWSNTWGWMDLRTVRLDVGTRLAAACDVPDLALFPARYHVQDSVTFHAALEYRLQHLALWCLAALRRIGLPMPIDQWALALNHCASIFDPVAGDRGGMCVSVTGTQAQGGRVRRTWQLTAPAENGPEIPCMPAFLLARRLASGDVPASGAYECMGFLRLDDFTSEFRRWGITTRTFETAA